MKTGNKFLLMLVLLACLFYGCKKGEDAQPIVAPLNDNSLPSAAILDIQVLDRTSTGLKFRMDIAVFRDSKNIENNLDASYFNIDSLDFRGQIRNFSNSLTRLISGSTGENYSALMLMDQSGSIGTTDKDDYRLDAAGIFCSNLGSGNNTALWSFSGSTYARLADFTVDTVKVIQEIEKLRGQQGGSTPLYKAQYDAVTYTKGHSTKPRKAVLTFTDGENSASGPTSEDVIQHANNQKVTLYNIGLGEVNTVHLQQQAIATDGAFMYAKDARQLISIFGNLGKILANTATYYQLEWVINNPDPATPFPSSGEIAHELRITFPFGGEIAVPFRFTYE